MGVPRICKFLDRHQKSENRKYRIVGAKTETLAIDKVVNHPMKRKITSNHISIQCWDYSTYWTMHCTEYIVLHGFL